MTLPRDAVRREFDKFVEMNGNVAIRMASQDSLNCNDIEESGDITYVGDEDSEGNWMVTKMDESSGVAIQYATISNNSTIETYSDAWDNRATLTYEDYSEVN